MANPDMKYAGKMGMLFGRMILYLTESMMILGFNVEIYFIILLNVSRYILNEGLSTHEKTRKNWDQ